MWKGRLRLNEREREREREGEGGREGGREGGQEGKRERERERKAKNTSHLGISPSSHEGVLMTMKLYRAVNHMTTDSN